MYQPRLNYYGLGQQVSVFRLSYRTEAGERFPQEVADRLRTLSEALNDIQLAEDAQTERLRVQNALIETKDSLETLERHNFPEPKLLAQIQIDLVRMNNELDPDQSHGQHR